MTDPQTAADAAERVQRWLDARPQDDREGGHIVYTVPDPDRTRGRWLHLTEPDLRTLLADRARMAAELEQVRGERAAAQPPIVAELMRLTPEQLSVRRCAWCSPNPTMAGLWCLCIAACGNTNCKHDEAEATATRPADGKRTPEQWCAEYGIDIADPDGWRNTGDPAWDEPITLPDFLRRAARSTTRGLTPDVWNRLSREAHEAADVEKGPKSP